MPFSIRKQSCTDSNGRRGNYIIWNRATKSKVSCHGTREDAIAAARIRIENSDDLSEDQKKKELENL